MQVCKEDKSARYARGRKGVRADVRCEIVQQL